MKVSFIEPKAPFDNFYTRVIRRLPMIGPIYLATILKRAVHEVTVYNENMERVDLRWLADSDVVCISIMTATAPRGYEIAETYKKLNEKGRVIIGGCHATFAPEEAMEFADHVVTGEGEAVISDLVNYGGEALVRGSIIENLDDLPFPDFSVMHGKKWPAVTPVTTSRGCPNDCIFCSVTPMFGRKYRARSPQSVFKEIQRSNHKHIFFTDDNFGVNRKTTKELLDLMIRYWSRKTKWTAQSSVRIAQDEEMLEMMRQAGCSMIAIGFESMNPRTLKSYGKNQTPEDVRKCIKVLHRYGIRVHGMFISEGYSDIYHKLGVDTLQLTVLTPIIGSKLYKAVKDAGSFVTEKYPTDWKLFDGMHVVHWPENMSPLDMQKQTMKALEKFYSPVNMLRMLSRGKIYDFLIRGDGRLALRRWQWQNKEYLLWLKRSLSLAEEPSG